MSELVREQPAGIAQPYAHYSTVTRAGQRLYVAGLVSIDETGELVAPGDPRAQTAHVCRGLQSICEQYGADLGRVARVTMYITDRAHYQEANAGYAEVFGEHKPSRATVIAGLTDPAFLVEIVATVELEDAG